jgi:hypothetical protein
MEAALENATEQITGANGSTIEFVYDSNKKLSEILVMDQPDRATATKIWRWNNGGLGFSSNGYSGPYSLAMTQDGSIVATMITTGTLNASLLKVGILQDLAGTNYWNMQTGAFRLKNGNQVGIESTNGVLHINADCIDVGILKSATGTGTQFNLATGQITTVGEAGAGSTFDNQTIMSGGQIQFFSGAGTGATLVGTISSADGSPVLVINIVNQLNIDGKIFFLDDVVVGQNSNVTVTDTGGLSFDGYTGTITDMYGNDFEVIKGIIVQPT